MASEELQRLQRELEAEAGEWRAQAFASRSGLEQLQDALRRQEGQLEKAAERHAVVQEEVIALRIRRSQLEEETLQQKELLEAFQRAF